jgi:hypothetical protein
MLSIHLPEASSNFEAEFERIFGIKLVPVFPECVPASDVQVCPTTPMEVIGYMELVESRPHAR